LTADIAPAARAEAAAQMAVDALEAKKASRLEAVAKLGDEEKKEDGVDPEKVT